VKHEEELKRPEHCGQFGEDEDDPRCGFYTLQDEKNIIDLAKDIVEEGWEYERHYLYRVQNFQETREECLVDGWIGHTRYAWMDLTSGPFSWGPTIKGEGTKLESTIPRIPPKGNYSHQFI